MNNEIVAPVTFLTALYFSCVTTTTLGYGDFAPEGISRVFAVFQAFLGMAVVGAVISKVLTRHQGQKIAETNLIAVTERSASVFMALNDQLVEFQEISRSEQHANLKEGERNKLVRRWGNAELRFSFLLETIQQLLGKQETAPATMIKILKALSNTVVEFEAASQVCGVPLGSLTSISQLLNICESTGTTSDLSTDQSIERILNCLNSIAVTDFAV